MSSSESDEFDNEWGSAGEEGNSVESMSDSEFDAGGAVAPAFGEAWTRCWWGAAAVARAVDLDDRRHEGTRFAVLRNRTELLSSMRARMRALATRLESDAGVQIEPSAAMTLLQNFQWSVQRIIDRFWSDEFGEGGMMAHYGCAPALQQRTWSPLAATSHDECPVCMEDSVDEVFHLGDERDAMCRPCWVRSLRDVALATEGLAAATKRCAHSAAAIPADVWEDILAPADYETYLSRLTEHFVASSEDVLWCLSNPCGVAIELRARAAQSASAAAGASGRRYIGVKCVCNATFCFSCARAASRFPALGDCERNSGSHEPASCDHIEQWLGSGGLAVAGGGDGTPRPLGAAGRARSLGNEELTLAFMRAYTKKCPQCETPIFQDRGCLEIKCAQCNLKFCWEVSEVFLLSSFFFLFDP